MQCCRSQQRDRRRSGEVDIGWTTKRPERGPKRHVVEAEDLLHAAVAVGGHDEDTSWEVAAPDGEPQHDVVVELALLPVLDELEGSVRTSHVVEKGAENERPRESFDPRFGSHPFRMRHPAGHATVTVNLRCHPLG